MTRDFANIEAAINEFKAGKMLILVDDENRENEGDIIIAADKITDKDINFMATHARGLICLPMSPERIEQLKLPMMVRDNTSPYQTAFTVSIEAKTGVSTGISAQDRATTIKAAIAPNASPNDIVTPGHIFPLKAQAEGVLSRRGQTEGSVDMAKLAGLTPAAVICEVTNEDGTMARRDALSLFSQKHGIRIITIEEIVHYRLMKEVLVDELASASLPVKGLGDFTVKVFSNVYDKQEHIALIKLPFDTPPLVRVHSECLTGDVFSSLRCDCGPQLDASLQQIAKEGGVLLYMRQEGRGIGLVNKIKAYALQQEKGMDTVEANTFLGLPTDSRDYAVSAQILKYLGIQTIRLMTNNPNKIDGLTKYGLAVSERVPVCITPNEDNLFYLQTKKEKLGHLFNSINAEGL